MYEHTALIAVRNRAALKFIDRLRKQTSNHQLTEMYFDAELELRKAMWRIMKGQQLCPKN